MISPLASRAIIPSVVLFPTPDPAKIPTLCPSPIVSNPSIALTPVGRIVSILFLFKGSGGIASNGYGTPFSLLSPSKGFPSPSNICPNKCSPQLTERGCPSGSTLQPGAIPTNSPNGINITVSSLNPTTSHLMISFLMLYIIHTSPTAALMPSASIVSPTTLDTVP